MVYVQSERKDRKKEKDRKEKDVVGLQKSSSSPLVVSSLLTSLLLVGLDSFGTSKAGLESNLATPLSQMEKKEKEREKDLEKRWGWSS